MNKLGPQDIEMDYMSAEAKKAPPIPLMRPALIAFDRLQAEQSGRKPKFQATQAPTEEELRKLAEVMRMRGSLSLAFGDQDLTQSLMAVPKVVEQLGDKDKTLRNAMLCLDELDKALMEAGIEDRVKFFELMAEEQKKAVANKSGFWAWVERAYAGAKWVAKVRTVLSTIKSACTFMHSDEFKFAMSAMTIATAFIL